MIHRNLKHTSSCAVLFLTALMTPLASTPSVAGVYASAVDDTDDSASPYIAESPETTRDKACFDTSNHRKLLVNVDRGVRLEVLDWGGTGEPMVLLTGLGNSAHVFDEFAYQFTDRFWVLGITRRGYGNSSKPAHGYDLQTRLADIIKVLDHFNIERAIFVGHSIAGVELSGLGAEFPERVSKLVYLDAYDYGDLHKQIPPPPGPPSRPSDGLSPQHADASAVRALGHRGVIADLCNVTRIGVNGRVGTSKTPNEITAEIIASSGLAHFERINAPTLGIFADPQADPPYVKLLTPADLEQYRLAMQARDIWQHDVIQRFSSGIRDVRVVKVRNAAHYVFISHEAQVVRVMRTFLLGQQ
jgi:pimeloyl-ACP methyl ester carboxylesterase